MMLMTRSGYVFIFTKYRLVFLPTALGVTTQMCLLTFWGGRNEKSPSFASFAGTTFRKISSKPRNSGCQTFVMSQIALSQHKQHNTPGQVLVPTSAAVLFLSPSNM